LKILVLATDIYTHGGIARYTWTLASTLGDLVGPDNVRVLALLSSGHAQRATEGFQVLGAAGERPAPAAKVRFVARAVTQARRKFDLAICSHVALAPIAAAAQALHGKPFWVACHDAEVWNPVSALKLASLKRAQLALAVSRFTAEKLHEINGIASEKIRVVHNAIPHEFGELLLSERDKIDRSAREANQGRYILSVGSLAKAHSYKGFDTTIRALPQVLAKCPGTRYVIVGTGDDQPRLRTIAGEAGVRENVVFAGRLSDQELADFYHGCEVFVLPSRTAVVAGRWHGEGFGRVYVEAALAGRPVIGSTGGGAAEAVLHGRTGWLVDPNSVVELSAALLMLLQNSHLAAALGRAGRRWASQAFTQASLRSQLAGMLGRAVHSEVRN
jgi:phosphatidyl-myo-inositol dimannoside synthase